MAASPNVGDLSQAQRGKLESWLVRFDQAWQEGSLAEWAGRLAELPETVRPAALVELVKIDLERQWAQGRQVALEAYLDAHPDLGTLESVPAGLIFAEYEVRRQFGAPADLAEFARRFPGQEAELSKLVQRAEAERTGAPPEAGPEPTLAHRDTSKAALSTAGPASGGSSEELPREFGRYRLEKKLGEGGMGSVYLAHDTQLDRQVALKVPRFSPDDSPQVIERFLREARSAATLHHPNVCPVHDVGEIEGVHYLTMAHIEGHTLSQFIRPDKPLPERQVAAVVRKLALALQDAHDHGVIHRDLKPSNVMIDRRHEPVIMDFGLARRVDAEQSKLTQSGALLGTPAYMSPEQVMGKPEEIGPQVDVYSLGVILYELLAGRVPFQGPPAAVIGQILTAEPPPLEEHRADLDPRLGAICGTAMAKNREERYGSMRELADSLAEYLKTPVRPTGTWSPGSPPPLPGGEAAGAGEITHALAAAAAAPDRRAAGEPHGSAPSPPGAATPAGRLKAALQRLQRRKVLLIAGATLPLIFLLGIVLLVRTPKGTLRVEVDDPRLEVLIDGEAITIHDQRGERSLKATTHRLAVKLGDVNIPLGETVRITTAEYNGEYRVAVHLGETEVVGEEFEVVRRDNPVLRVSLVSVADQPRAGLVGENPQPVLSGSASTPLPGLVGEPAELPGIDRWQMETARPRTELVSVAVSPDGRWIACKSNLGVIRVYDAETLALVRVFLAHTRDYVFGSGAGRDLYWNPDSQRLASLERSTGNVRIWHLNGVQERVIQVNPTGLQGITWMSWHPDGTQLALATAGGKIRLWDVSRRRMRVLDKGDIPFTRIDFSPDGTCIATGDDKGEVRLWTVEGELLRTIKAHSSEITALTWSPDGDRLAAAGGKMVRIWDSKGNLKLELPEQEATVRDIAWYSNGTYIATAYYQAAHPANYCKIWKADGTLVTEVMLEHESINGLAWSPRSDELVIAGTNLQSVELGGKVRKSLTGTMRRGPGEGGWNLTWSPDGRYLADADWGMPVWTADGRLARMMGQDGWCSASWGPGNRLSISDWGEDKTPIQIYDLQGQKGPALSLSPPREASGAWCVSNDILAVGSYGTLLFWKPGSAPTDELKAHDGKFKKEWSPDGSLLATGGRDDGIVKLWKPDGSLVRVLGRHDDGITSLAWSPDGSKVAAGAGRTHPIRIWSIDGSSTQDLASGGYYCMNLFWRPDRPEIIVAASDAHVRCFRLDGRQVWSFRADTRSLRTMDCSPDGKKIAVTGIGSTLSVYDADSQSPLWRSVCVSGDERGYLNIDATGRLIHGDPELLRQEVVFIVEKEGVQETLSYDDFSKRFNVNLLEPNAYAPVRGEDGRSGGEPGEQHSRGLEIGPAVPRPEVGPLEFELEPATVDFSKPDTQQLLVARPAPLEGLQWWTIVSRSHRGALYKIAYSPDGSLLATAGGDATVRIWDADENKLLHVLLGHSGPVTDVAWCPNSEALASVGVGGSPVLIWDVVTGGPLGKINLETGGSRRLAWSPDGTSLAVGFSYGENGLAVYAVVHGQLRWRRSAAPVRSLAYSPDGKWLAHADDTGRSVTRSDAATGEPRTVFPEVDRVIGFTGDGRWLLAQDRNHLRILDVARGEEHEAISLDAEGFFLSPDGRTLDAFSPKRHGLWDLPTLRETQVIERPCWGGPTAAFSPDGRTLTVSHSSGTFWSCNVENGLITAERRDVATDYGGFHSGAFDLSRDGRYLVQGLINCIEVWDLVSGRRTLLEDVNPTWIEAARWSPDGARIAVSRYGDIVLFDAASGGQIRSIPGGAGNVMELAWAPDGRRLASGDEKGHVAVWDAESGAAEAEWDLPGQIATLAWSPDGRRLAAAGGETSGIWEMPSARMVRALDAAGPVVQLAWSRDGEALAGLRHVSTRYAHRVVCVWDANTGHTLTEEETGMVRGTVAWSERGKSVLYSVTREGYEHPYRPFQLRELTIGAGSTVQAELPYGRFVSPERFLPLPNAFATTLYLRRHAGETQLFEFRTGKPLRTLVPLHNNQWIALTPEGHWQGSEKAAEELLYVGVADDGRQFLFTPDEFAAQFGWKNDPSRVPFTANAASQDPAPLQ